MNTAWKSAPERVWEREDFDWSSWDVFDEDDVGHSTAQFEAILYLLGCLAQWRIERDRPELYVGSDQFFRLHTTRRYAQISPDVYVTEGPLPIPPPKSWPLGTPLLLAVEMVSEDWLKDYRDAPDRYSRLGARELVLFDPEAAERRARQGALFIHEPLPGRQPCSLYRADEHGILQLIHAGSGPCYSQVLDAWLLPIQRDALQLLAIANDPLGQRLIPHRVHAEQRRADAERLRAEAERQLAEAERMRTEAERMRAEAEQLRADTEQQRADTEQQRADTEQQRADTEQQRADTERQRAEAERLRADAERQRADTEQQRAEAEQQRADTEQLRADAERLRAEAAEAELARLRALLRVPQAGDDETY